MDEATRRALRAVNRRFYDRWAGEFSASRERPWPGWTRLAEHLARAPSAVLDVGCGNGRFGAFLAARRPPPRRYLGLDGCGALLRIAEARLAEVRLPGGGTELRRLDVLDADLETALSGERFDLVALFGVLHHVPGRRSRRALLRRLARLVAPGGLLAASVWRLDAAELERRALSWEAWNGELRRRGTRPLDLAQLEDGDVLLGWRGSAETPRYCHFPGEEEIEAWIAALECPLLDRFEADGPSRRDNLYLIFRGRVSSRSCR